VWLMGEGNQELAQGLCHHEAELSC
jgi:hypothetical protein